MEGAVIAGEAAAQRILSSSQENRRDFISDNLKDRQTTMIIKWIAFLGSDITGLYKRVLIKAVKVM